MRVALSAAEFTAQYQLPTRKPNHASIEAGAARWLVGGKREPGGMEHMGRV